MWYNVLNLCYTDCSVRAANPASTVGARLKTINQNMWYNVLNLCYTRCVAVDWR